MNFAHLHVHTEYSLLDGSNKIKEYVARVKDLGMNSAAITDHGFSITILCIASTMATTSDTLFSTYSLEISACSADA